MKKIDFTTVTSLVIYDPTGNQSFTISPPTLSTSPSLKFLTKDADLFIGARVAFEYSFAATNFQNKGAAVDYTRIDFGQFFRFVALPQNQVLKVELIEPVDAPAGDDFTLKFFSILQVIPGENMAVTTGYVDAAPPAAGIVVTRPASPYVPVQVAETMETLSDPITFFAKTSFSSALQANNVTDGGQDLTGGPFRKSLEEDLETTRNASFIPIGLQPINPPNTKDVSFWTAIRNATDALSYTNYSAFMDFLFCDGIYPFKKSGNADTTFREKLQEANSRIAMPFNNVDSYRALKVATQAFVMANLRVAGEPDPMLANEFKHYERALKGYDLAEKREEEFGVIPYLAIIRQQMQDVDIKFHPFDEALTKYIGTKDVPGSQFADRCYGIIKHKLQYPCLLELIWNYWHEESMMIQGIGTVARRFQNIRGEEPIDPLANLEISPLRSLNNLLWGYIQDEQHRLTVRRRAYEYNHHYGISLQGKAVTSLRPADSRSKFIEAFHTLLNLCVKFYKQYDDTTVVADGFPVMNALKEVHLILSEGAHNQYGDLPSTARIEMLMQQYILARPEFREFLLSRPMVAYPEPWMDRVAALNQMHNWTHTNVLHYRDLGVFGEQIVLSVRFGAWSTVFNRDQAANWAIFWRPQIQNYIHAYRAVTGVDLSREDGRIDVQQPSIHLVRRLREQNHQKLPTRIGK